MNQKSKKLAMVAAALATLLIAGCASDEEHPGNHEARMGECFGIHGETGPVKMSFDDCMSAHGAFRDGFNMK